jgi:single-strand DNA-binding protein
MNKAILCGNVGGDPKVGTTKGDKTWAQVSLATNEVWKDRDGNKQEKTSWHRLKFWGRQADVVQQYVHKGDKLLVEGRIEYGEYENNDGELVKTTEIVVSNMTMLGNKGKREEATSESDDLPF